MKKHTFNNIVLGQEESFSRSFSKEDISHFAALSGDFNPLHLDDEYASKTEFGNVLVHGMLAGSLFSTLVGMYLPGKYCLYLSQELKFRAPVKIGEKLNIVGRVVEKSNSLKTLTIETLIFNEAKIALISGKAVVKVLK